MDNSINTKVWTNATKRPKNRTGTGIRKGIRPKKIAVTRWSPVMLPKSLRPSESGLARWPDQFDGHKEDRKPPERPHKVLEILDAVLPDTVHVRQHEDGQ